MSNDAPSDERSEPGAGSAPINGQVNLANHGFSMPAVGSLYTIPGVLEWKDSDFVLIDYLTDAQSAAAFLPKALTTVPIPELPGYTMRASNGLYRRDCSSTDWANIARRCYPVRHSA